MNESTASPIGGQSESAHIPGVDTDASRARAVPPTGVEASFRVYPSPPPNEGPPPSDWRADAAAAQQAQTRKEARAEGRKNPDGAARKERDKYREYLKSIGYKGVKPAQVAAALGKLTQIWPDWLAAGEMSMLKSPPKYGKTRTYLSIIKAMHAAHEWPDGSVNRHVGSRALVLPYDNNTLEIQEELERLGIEDAVTIPHDPEDETGSRVLNLDDPRLVEMVDFLVDEDPTYRLLVVDTLTYASVLSLNKPDEMKRMLDPIMDVAARRGLALLVLIHQNAQGGALGRRITERARILWGLERVTEGDPSRLRLSVEETNLPRRPSLLVTHVEAGVEFGACQDDGSRPAPTEDAFAEWLVEWLRSRGREASWHDVMREAGTERVGGLGEDGRPTGRKILDRAVKRINAGSPSLARLGRIRIATTPRNPPGSNRDVSHYSVRSLDEDCVLEFLDSETTSGGSTSWGNLAEAYNAWAVDNNRPEIGAAEIRFAVAAECPQTHGYMARLSVGAPPPPSQRVTDAVLNASEHLAQVKAAQAGVESAPAPTPGEEVVARLRVAPPIKDT